MTASKRATHGASRKQADEARPAARTDDAAVEAHIITREEYEEIPELDDQWFEEADHYVGDVLVKRGRPRSPRPKRLVSLRLSPEVLDHFRAGGPGWQTRINDILRAVVSFERDEAERAAKADAPAPSTRTSAAR
jgi:uncharacterized protein (DUF4415 family)